MIVNMAVAVAVIPPVILVALVNRTDILDVFDAVRPMPYIGIRRA